MRKPENRNSLASGWLAGFLALAALGIALSVTAENSTALRERLAELKVGPMETPPKFTEEKLKLGQALFFDPVLGGNQDVACATCHHPLTATGDGRSRAVGTQAYVDKGRRMPVGFSLVDVEGQDSVLTGFNMSGAAHPFTPRNSPDIFNRGDSEWRTMFWDSRAHKREDGTFAVNQLRLSKSPGLYQAVMPAFVENVLAAQAMMPVLSNDEMRGTKGETSVTGAHNEVGTIPGQNEEQIWATLMKRLLEIDGYRKLFREAYPDIPLEKLHFGHAANAIAAFEIDAFTFLDSPWDRYLAGDDSALNPRQLQGAELFYGKAKCFECHSGRLMTDQEPHNIGVIPIGPGPDHNEDADYGIAHRSNAGLDRKYAFRTPPLRNVELTGPYMHNGAYRTLEAAVRQGLDPVGQLRSYDKTQLEPEFRGAVHDEEEILTDVLRTLDEKVKEPLALDDDEVGALVEFLKALTSPSARDLRSTIPESVPSGLKMVAPIPDEAVAELTKQG
ncbi:MAG: c-type cytochrome [Verrucomicrobiae bacterium]|nr:c-type cytochrome [Verrucomicrobiae bacterium]